MWCVFPAVIQVFGLLILCNVLHTRKAFPSGPSKLGTGYNAKALWIVSRKGRAVAYVVAPFF